MKKFRFQWLLILCSLSQSMTISAQILTSKIEVRIGPTVIEDATTVQGTVTINKAAVPDNGTRDAEAHLELVGSAVSETDLLGIKFQQVGSNPFAGQIRFNSEGFHFTDGDSQDRRSIHAENLYAAGQVQGNSFAGTDGSASDFPSGLTASSVTSNHISGGNYTNQSGGAANFPAGIVSDKVEGEVVEWTNFSANVSRDIFTGVPQGIYLLTVRGRGLYHAYATFIIHCYDSANKGAIRLYNTGYQSEWTIGWNEVVWVGNNNFTIKAKVSQGQQGRFSLLRLN